MSKLWEKINNDVKIALREKRAAELSTLRMLVAAIRNKEISLRAGDKPELTDEQIIEVVGGEIKKRRDAIEAYKQGQRQDLADKESEEARILEKYLPAQLPDEELEKIIKEILASGEKNFGKIMGQVMAKVKGRVQGNRAGEMVKKLLA